ncbi:cadherin repeat domain-containing protein, partial [Marinomonas lutimaris]|uniref:cadherin repeat domain-containing protein n=1 Tax=Marinomonas lutimaris TaxID=2846746 RepID=UPI001C67E87C
IYTATATDADGTATNNTLQYSLSGDDAALLDINAVTGVVTLKALADYETKSSYSFNVIATDNGAGNLNSGSLSTTQAVTVSVNDLNDNTPIMTSGATGSVNENA